MKLRIIQLLTIMLCCNVAMAQSNRNDDFKEQYEEFRRQTIKEYSDFRHRLKQNTKAKDEEDEDVKVIIVDTIVPPADGEEQADTVQTSEEQKDSVPGDGFTEETKVKQSLFPICVDGRWGYKNVNGEIVVPCEYDSVSGYERGDKFPYAAHKDGKIDLYHGEYRGEYEKVSWFGDIVDYIPLALTWRLGTVNSDNRINPLVGIGMIVKLEWEWNNEVKQEWIGEDWVQTGDWDSFYEDLDMDNVSYDNHVFENDEVAYIIVKQLSNNKWGVIPYDYDSRKDKGKETIPFIYDSITFVKGDKSKVEVYNADTGERKVISLVE